MTEDDAADPTIGEEITEGGIELAAALTGAAVGLVGGPIGSFGGAAAGVLVSRTAKVTVERLRTSRARDRAAAALVLMAADARARKSRGERLREDGFWDSDGNLRADAVEILEAVLLQAAHAHEERKVKLLAELYSAVAHDASIAAADAHLHVRTAGELTYRQFVALGVFAAPGGLKPLLDFHIAVEDAADKLDPAIALEVDDLADRRLIGLARGSVVAPASMAAYGSTGNYGSTGSVTTYGDGWTAIRPLPAGTTLARLTGVDRLGVEEKRAWLEAVRRW